MPNVADLAEQIQQLSPVDQHALMRKVMTDSDASEPDADELWQEEIVRRVKAIRNGEAAIRALQDNWTE